MERYASIFLAVATAAALVGFSGVAAGVAWVAQTLFFVFLAAFLALVIVGFVQGPA